MPEKAHGKIQNLLTRAARKDDPATQKDSSVAGTTRVLPTITEAEKLFSILHRKLFQIEHWNVCSNISTFELFDETGKAQPTKPAAAGDFVKITLPGSGKDDWVKIISIDEAQDETILTLKPSPNPVDKENQQTTSHFFTDDSTNNFCLQREAEKINFYVIGLDETANTEETSGVLETVRNYATAKLGCLLGIQKTQWETFCSNFLEIEKSN